jgi:hypothetical protein
LQRVGGGLHAVVHPEFDQDRTDVAAGGFGADMQRGGDRGVAVAGGDQREYFALPASQSIRVGECVGAPGAGWVFHIRDARFDSMREYINPSNPATSILLSLVLRAYPFLARWRARGAAAS